MSIGFLGAGRIAQALAKGFIAAGVCDSSRIIASCPERHLLEQIQSLGCRTSYENGDVLREAQTVFIAVKPPVMPEVLASISSFVQERHLMVSLAMGVRIRDMESALPQKCRVIRVMPNTPCLVQEGASVFARGTSATAEDGQLVRSLLSSVGICEEAEDEEMLDAVTGLSGSGPGYVFMMIEALADGAVQQGMPRDMSYRLAAQTLLGAAKMVLETKRHPGSLKDDVCSPGGSTIEGVYQLEKLGLRAALIEAVAAGTAKSRSK
ncbi:pyrroline-5-carboxylate reductase 2-like [Ornithodoros turicata]